MRKLNSDRYKSRLHGSGTPIGDALELEGMNMARTELGVGAQSYTVGSNKGNIGNCEASNISQVLRRRLKLLQAASGLVSVIKLCKSIQHGYIPPLQSFEALNPMINARLPVKIAAEGIPISSGAVVSVSSTGLGGVNAHCVMSFPPATRGRKLARVTYSRREPVAASTVLPPMAIKPLHEGNSQLVVLIEQASEILNLRLKATTNLKDASLDSRGQMMLMHKIHDTLPGSHIPCVFL
jgi:acyl transferase domain-containing protein